MIEALLESTLVVSSKLRSFLGLGYLLVEKKDGRLLDLSPGFFLFSVSSDAAIQMIRLLLGMQMK